MVLLARPKSREDLRGQSENDFEGQNDENNDTQTSMTERQFHKLGPFGGSISGPATRPLHTLSASLTKGYPARFQRRFPLSGSA